MRALLVGAALFAVLPPTRPALAQDTAMTGETVLPTIRTFADNLIAHARDRYGPKHTPFFMSQLDIKSKTIPPRVWGVSGTDYEIAWCPACPIRAVASAFRPKTPKGCRGIS